MDFSTLLQTMKENTKRIRTLVEGISQDDAVWKPDSTSWSILEVVNHLYDEEKEDFRVRLKIILQSPDQPWPGIDPEGWVVDRKYNQRNLRESLQNFLDERASSLTWLQALEQPDWDALYESPFGSMRAGDMFAAWVAHDLLHMRQLVELLRALVVRGAKPFQVEYAGEW